MKVCFSKLFYTKKSGYGDGSVIYLCSYLSTMFGISDVMIDKEEISMTFQVPVHVPKDLSLPETETIRDEQITVMEADGCVSGPHDKHSIVFICSKPILQFSYVGYIVFSSPLFSFR